MGTLKSNAGIPLDDLMRETMTMLGNRENSMWANIEEVSRGCSTESEEWCSYRQWLVHLHKMKNEIEWVLSIMPQPKPPLLTDDLG